MAEDNVGRLKTQRTASEDNKAKDPVLKETEKALNCIFFGHVGAGKSELVLKLGGHVDTDTDSVDFGRAYFLTKTTRFNMLEAPSHSKYVPKLITRALEEADIGVLVISAAEDGLDEDVKVFQTLEYAFLIRVLGISRIVVVVNKMDNALMWSQKSFDEVKEGLSWFLGTLGYCVGKDANFIPVSSLLDLNIKKKVGDEICSWWSDVCLSEAFESFEVPLEYTRGRLRPGLQNRKVGQGAHYDQTGWNAVHFATKKFVEELISIDLRLDDDSTNENLWRERANCIYNDLMRITGKTLKDTEPYKGKYRPEASRKCLGAFEAALQARKQDTLLLWRILGDGYREQGDFQLACGCYTKCLDFATMEKSSEMERVFHTLLVDTMQQEEEYNAELQEQENEKRKLKNAKKKEKRRARKGHQNIVCDERKNEEDEQGLLGKEDNQQKNAMGARKGHQNIVCDELKNEEDEQGLLGKEDNQQENAMGAGEESKLLVELSEHGEDASIDANITYKCEVGVSGRASYRDRSSEKDEGLWIVKLSPLDSHTLQFCRTVNHDNLLRYRFDHVCEDGSHSVAFEPFNMTLVEYIERENQEVRGDKLIMEYTILSGRGSERRTSKYVPPRYRKILKDMMSFMMYVQTRGYVIDYVDVEKLAVKDGVLKFHDLSFTMLLPACPENKIRRKSGYSFSKMIRSLFERFGFGTETEWPCDLQDFLSRLAKFKFDQDPDYLSRHLAVLSPLERTSFVPNIRNKRFCVDTGFGSPYSVCVDNMIVQTNDWTAQFKAKSDELGPVNDCFHYPNATYTNEKKSLLQFCRSLCHHLYKSFEEHGGSGFSTLDVDLTMMELFARELLSIAFELHRNGILHIFME